MSVVKGVAVISCVMILEACISSNYAGEKTVAVPAKKEQIKTELLEKVGEVTVGAQSYLDKPYTPSKFFDKDANTFWHSGNHDKDLGWLSISYSKPFKASGYKILRRSDSPSQAPVDFILEGATTQEFPEGTNNWKIIDEQKKQQWTDTSHTYAIKRPKDYRHYRIRILTTGDNSNAAIAEWELTK